MDIKAETADKFNFLWDAVHGKGSGLDQGLQGAVADGLGFAGRYEQDVVGAQGNIGCLAPQNISEVDGDFGPVIGVGKHAHDFGVLGGGGSIGAFGQGENLKGAECVVLAENVGSGFLDGADDVDGIGLRDGDDIVGLDEDVFGGIGRVHHAFDVDRGDREPPSGIVGGAGERYGSPFKAASDVDDGAGLLAKAAG